MSGYTMMGDKESFTVGWYGKIPSLGDFVSRRLPASFIDIWDTWLQKAMATSREQLGEHWLDLYLLGHSVLYRTIYKKQKRGQEDRTVLCISQESALVTCGIFISHVKDCGSIFNVSFHCDIPRSRMCSHPQTGARVPPSLPQVFPAAALICALAGWLGSLAASSSQQMIHAFNPTGSRTRK